MVALWENPIGTDGFEFVEYTAPDGGAASRCSSTWAFARWHAIVPRP